MYFNFSALRPNDNTVGFKCNDGILNMFQYSRFLARSMKSVINIFKKFLFA